MISHDYKERTARKLKKYKREYGPVEAYMRLVLYVLRDGINDLIMLVATATNPPRDPRNKKIIFLEPRNQGYGDLLFQTPLFEALRNNGYEVSVLVREKHSPVVLKNPSISRIYYWERIGDIARAHLSGYRTIIYLGRSTLAESITGLLFFPAHRIMLDRNIASWRRAFTRNHTRAWQILFDAYLGEDLHYPRPHLYLAHAAEQASSSRIAVIAGADKTEKRYPRMTELLEHMQTADAYSADLLGACDAEYAHRFDKLVSPRFRNYINESTYERALKRIAGAKAVVGTEGSLVHMSAVLGIPTIVIETGGSFWKYSGIEKTSLVRTLPGTTSPAEILGELEDLLRSSAR
jgi:hypothetical protein